MKRIRSFLKYGGRPAELALAVVFVAGAILKALDINLFTVQIRAYGLFSDPALLAWGALKTVCIETLLGTALLLRLRFRGWVYAALALVLVSFTGLILYGWFVHDLKDCGCFGPIEMSPGLSVAKNVLLLALTLIAWLSWRMQDAAQTQPAGFFRTRLALSVAAAAVAVAYAFSQLEPAAAASPENRPFAEFVFEADGARYDLGKGEYFIALLSMGCEHCKATVEKINAFYLEPDFPPVVALCYEEKENQLDEFREETGAAFPLYSLGDRIRLFSSLLGDAEVPPRFIYAYNGREIAHWNENVPELGQVKLARTATAAKAFAPEDGGSP